MAQAAVRLQTFWRCTSERRKYLIARGIIEARDNSRAIRNRAAFKIQKVAKAFVAKLHARKEIAMARRAKEEAFEVRLQAVKVRATDLLSRLMILLSNRERHCLLVMLITIHLCHHFFIPRLGVLFSPLQHIPTGRI